MKILVFLPFLLLGSAWAAEEPADRAAITTTIASLSGVPQAAGLFTSNPLRDPLPDPPGGSIVVISHQPWGEARIAFPGLEGFHLKFACRNIRFLTPDLATAEGDRTYSDQHGTVQTTPLLFVMKRVAGDWKIDSMHVLAASVQP